MIEAWLFDLDGTLVDTAPDLAAAANALRVAQGLAPLPLDHYRAHASSGARGLIGRALGVGPDDAAFEPLRQTFLAHYAAHIADHSQVFEGLDAALRWLEERGIPWGVVTNKPRRYTEPLMAALQLSARATVVVSADEVPFAKPAPDALIEACRRAGLAPQRCAYVGDDLRDIDAGRAAGMRTVTAEWGYLGTTRPEAWQADDRCATPAELLDLMHPLSTQG
jgi:N-acetyl-D-muramate 6-phosphate phosphatase